MLLLAQVSRNSLRIFILILIMKVFALCIIGLYNFECKYRLQFVIGGFVCHLLFCHCFPLRDGGHLFLREDK